MVLSFKIAICLIFTAAILIDVSIASKTELTRQILDRFMDSHPKDLFKVYHHLFAKTYSLNSEEGLKRYKIFKKELAYINQKNSQNLGFQLGLNNFADYTQEEFEQYYLTKPEILQEQRQKFRNYAASTDFDSMADLDDASEKVSIANNTNISIDWSEAFGVARDQGQCGCCWAFSVAGAVEGNYNIKNKVNGKFNNVSLSPQELIDCDTRINQGCNGGCPYVGLLYTFSTGLALETNYPYIATNRTCRAKSLDNKAKIKPSNFKMCINGDDSRPCNGGPWLDLLNQGPLMVLV